MGSGFYPQLRAALLAHDCWLVRQGKGSHEIWQSSINGKRFIVAVTIQSRVLANKILADAGIAKRL